MLYFVCWGCVFPILLVWLTTVFCFVCLFGVLGSVFRCIGVLFECLLPGCVVWYLRFIWFIAWELNLLFIVGIRCSKGLFELLFLLVT